MLLEKIRKCLFLLKPNKSVYCLLGNQRKKLPELLLTSKVVKALVFEKWSPFHNSATFHFVFDDVSQGCMVYVNDEIFPVQVFQKLSFTKHNRHPCRPLTIDLCANSINLRLWYDNLFR